MATVLHTSNGPQNQLLLRPAHRATLLAFVLHFSVRHAILAERGAEGPGNFLPLGPAYVQTSST